jgi:hypothetical protein
VTYLTRAICRRAGWDYEQVIVEQLLSSQQRQKFLIGYGIYFSAEPGFADFADELREVIDHWNRAELWVNHLTVNCFDGWAVGDALGEFVYFTHPIAALHHQALPMASGHLTRITDYTAATEQAEALARFLAILRGTENRPDMSMYVGAFQVTYSQP